MPPAYFPVNEFDPLMKGMVIGGMGILHVFLAQFAIGGGILLTYFEWLSGRGRWPDARRLVDSYFRLLVLISFVLGALTGVGMWFTAIQVSAPTIGLLMDAFHWLWATEWTFFCVEIIAGYAFYRYGDRLDHRARLTLLGIYSTAAWFSLFWINGILSFQLTPGAWPETRNLWSGFFNPSFWPSLAYRTVAAMAIAALVAAMVVNFMQDADRPLRQELLRLAARLLWPMAAMPVLGAWYLQSIPSEAREWVLGGSAAMTLFLGLGAGASLLVGLYALVGIVGFRLYINGATAALLLALAFAATAAGEFVREGVRKPFTASRVLYSSGITPDEVAHLRRVGSVSADPYPLREEGRYPSGQVKLGAKVYRFQCSVCHTLRGANGLTHLAGSWSIEQQRMNVAKLQRTKPFMPPFAGTPEELEALVQYLRWLEAGEPTAWPESRDPAAVERIARWLDEAGTSPGLSLARGHGKRYP